MHEGLIGELWPQATVIDAARIGEGFGLDGLLHRVRLAGAPHSSVVVKQWDPEQGQAEVHFYRHLNPGIRVPRCLLVRPGLLVLEDLTELTQGDVLAGASLERMEALVDAAARFHLALRGAEWDGRIQRTPQVAAGRIRELRDRAVAAGMSASLLDRVAAELDNGPELPSWTLIHGDLHLDNVLFDGVEPVVLDWQGLRRGDGVVDVTRLLVDAARTEVRREHGTALLDRYADAVGLARAEVQGRARTALGLCLTAILPWAIRHGPLGEDRESALLRRITSEVEDQLSRPV